MSGDYSRVRFDPLADFSGVQMQQGRVQLDSDWNEWAAILDRRHRAESVDTLGVHPKTGIEGVAVVSPQTPDAFKIELATGSGLRGEYFDDKNLSNLKLVRTDSEIDFDWQSGSPDASIGADTFSIRWTGWVEAPDDGDYTFSTRSDDGVRLWVDNQLLIDNWTDHPAETKTSDPISLQAGKKYGIKLEYYENTGVASIQLSWTPPGQNKAIIPPERLYPDFTVGRGRMYVDGLLAENHGFGAMEFDPVLAELRGKDPLPYDRQPYLPNPPALAAGDHYLAYLDVWRREVTHVQDPGLVEIAVGVDTTTRTQTVWQVRMLGDIGANANCASQDSDIPGWQDIIRPSGGRMSIRTQDASSDSGPCQLAPGGGYRGPENQLYRIEIHDAGDQSKATFKWSRDNASVESDVLEIHPGENGGNELKLASLGRDSVLRFNDGDWVEILDDRRELGGVDGDPRERHGEMRQIKVDDATQTISFTPALPDDLIPNGGDDTVETRHTRVKRWDQKGTVQTFDHTGKKVGNYKVDDHNGLLSLPAPGTWIELERGIQVSFDLDSAGGDFHCGDYWVSAARTADAKVEEFTQAPPRGIYHHFARLAVVTFPGDAPDCRTIWPPSASQCANFLVGDGVQSHGDYDSIQQALDALPTAGGQISLLPGQYPENLTISKSNVTIRGCGEESVIIADSADPVIRINGTSNIEIDAMRIIANTEGVGIQVDVPASGAPTGILLHNLEIKGSTKSAIAVFPGEQSNILSTQIDIRDNRIDALLTATESTIFVTADDVNIERNTIVAESDAVKVHLLARAALPEAVHVARTVNPTPVVMDTALAGAQAEIKQPEAVQSTRTVGPTATIDTPLIGAIQIGCTSERVRIVDNLIHGGGGNGITLGSIQDPTATAELGYQVSGALYEVRIERNRILGMGMNGIGVVKFFDLSGRDEFISVIRLDILGNTIRDCLKGQLPAPSDNMLPNMAYAGISLADVEMLRMHDNRIEDNGLEQFEGVCGVFVLHGEGVDISRNRIVNTGVVYATGLTYGKALRGGIVIKYAVPVITSMKLEFGDVSLNLARQNGIPAIRIHDNIVSQPLGQALQLGALGPVSIQDNSLTSRGILPSSLLDEVACTVLIINLGFSNESYYQFYVYALNQILADSKQGYYPIEGGAITVPRKGLDDFTVGQFLANGNVMFNNNQVVADLMQQDISFAFSSVAIISLDDVSFTGNQLDASFLFDYMVANAVILAMSLRVNDNRVKESTYFSFFSVLSRAFQLNYTIHNETTNCIVAEAGLPGAAQYQDNLILSDFSTNPPCSDIGAVWEKAIATLTKLYEAKRFLKG